MPAQSAAQPIPEPTAQAKRLALTGDSPIDLVVPYSVSLDDGETSRELSIGVTYDPTTGRLIGDGVLFNQHNVDGVTIPRYLAVRLIGGLSHPASEAHHLLPATIARLDEIAEETRAFRGTR